MILYNARDQGIYLTWRDDVALCLVAGPIYSPRVNSTLNLGVLIIVGV